MKKSIINLLTSISRHASFTILACSLLLMGGCTNNTASGAYIGGQFGHVIGSAIGGISGGWRGHEVGSLIGTVGGAVGGAAIGAAVDKAQEKKYEERTRQRQKQRGSGYNNRSMDIDDSGFYPNGRGDDRISFDTPAEAPLEIRNAGIVETINDGVLTKGEKCTVRFEIHNTSDQPVYDVRPLVGDVTGNKHVKISPNLNIESIDARQGVRYSATILADSRLKDGEIQIMIGVAQGRKTVGSQTRYFTVPTAKTRR